jgi:hypothetical protein
MATFNADDGDPRMTCNVSAGTTEGVAENASVRPAKAAPINLFFVIVTCLSDHGVCRNYFRSLRRPCPGYAFIARINALQPLIDVDIWQQIVQWAIKQTRSSKLKRVVKDKKTVPGRSVRTLTWKWS